MEVRKYYDDYVGWFPNEWQWSLKGNGEQNQRYLETRARRCSSDPYRNNDKLPKFESIERDAEQFGLAHITYTDFFGLEWEGKKGVHRLVGAPDYEGHLYFFDEESDYADEDGRCVSDDYDAYNNQPPADTFVRLDSYTGNEWVDVKNISDVEYNYMVDNHLFKDTRIDVKYPDGQELTVFSDYSAFLKALGEIGKPGLLDKVYAKMDEHFIKLRDSDREEEKEIYDTQVKGLSAKDFFEKR